MKKLLKNTAGVVVLLSLASASMAFERMNSEGRQSGERRGPPAFADLDLDADGVLTFAEFEQHKIRRGDHATLFNRVDQNGDGSILEDEWSSHKPPRGRGGERGERGDRQTESE